MEIGKSFRLTKRLGSGAFGEIFLGINTKTNTEVAIKIEKQSSPVPQLLQEAEIYKKLLGDANYTDQGIPHVYYVASESDYNYMVMDKLGKSLEDLFVICRKKFSLKTTIMLALQMLERIRFIHSKEIIHRDIKPDNFLMGVNYKSNKLFIIDFGLAKRVIKERRHIPYRENKTLTGTARYASLNTHLGIEQSRRDDLECMMYCLLYFLKGQLPWMSLKAKNKKEKYDRIMEKKMTAKIDSMFDGPGQKKLGEILYYIRGLDFDQIPDYEYIKEIFNSIMKENNFTYDLIYDWVILENKNKLNKSGSLRSNSNKQKE